MLYPTLNQPLMLFIVSCCGIFCAIVFDIAQVFSKRKVLRHVTDFFAVTFSFGMLFLVNLLFNYGQFRIYVLALFMLSFAIQKIISKFLWTKLIKKCYIKLRRKN